MSTRVQVPKEARGRCLLELEIQAAGRDLMWVLGTKLQLSAWAIHVLSHWALPPALRIFSCKFWPRNQKQTTSSQ